MRRSLGLTTGLAAGLAAGYGIRRWAARPRPAIEPVAHRGGAATAPENTLAAFRAALAAGIVTWELDVQLTRDSALVVFHDETLDRTSNGQGPLAGRLLADLQQLDAGAWFGPQWQGEPIPTLEAVIALARTAPNGGARLLIEIKSPHLYPGIERRLLAVLAAQHYTERVLLMSFDGASLGEVRKLAPRLPLCQLFAQETPFPVTPAARAEVLGPMWQMLAVNPLPIYLAHRAGRQVYTWTVNDPAALHWLRLCGVDGVISDRLDLLQMIGADRS
ncbi:MAG TPA: glycerophosphodiester phosphodiesterase family protein [Chloroflexia bacterium]|nr:glycerophosphodiester phosphodiesterase family protein [Chloroflexia bacterium]